jgi:hypothetical protein
MVVGAMARSISVDDQTRREGRRFGGERANSRGDRHESLSPPPCGNAIVGVAVSALLWVMFLLLLLAVFWR